MPIDSITGRGHDGEATMTCRELNDLLGDYRTGDLPPDLRPGVEAHLMGCAACVAYVRSYEEAVRLAKESASGLEQILLPAAPEELIAAILESTSRAGKSRPGGS
jgi:anti-sigma factor RsiW